MKFENMLAVQKIMDKRRVLKNLRNAGQNDLQAKSKVLPEDAQRMYRDAARKAGPTLQDWYSNDGFRQVQFLKSIQKLKK